MRPTNRLTAVSAILLAFMLVMPLAAQSRSDREKMAAQTHLAAAEAALASAEAAGAANSSLYMEAAARLRQARANWNSDKGTMRESAGRRAIEARAAAAAAEAQALLLNANAEIRNLRTDINNFGGTAATINLYEPPAVMNRGATSRDHVNSAETALQSARTAGADRFAAAELERLDRSLDTARTLSKNFRQNDAADHLAFVAEMRALELEYTARHNMLSGTLPQMRAERTRLAQQMADSRAKDEQERRYAAEQEAQALRSQLAAEAANRQAEQAELDRLRQQVANAETQFRSRLDEDRTARIAAEEALDDLLMRYETALVPGSPTNAEVESLRRQVEDQSLALQSLQNREKLSETSLNNQIASLEQALERERAGGRLTADVLAQREEELRRQRNELQTLQTQREEAERTRVNAMAEAEQKRAHAEQEAALLRQQVAQTSAALEDAREELTRRDEASNERLSTMQQALSKLAETRTSDRGFIVTLPGLFFDSGKSVLKPGARNTLSKIADQLKMTNEAAIQIEGHTDSVGTEELNQRLSEKRAAAVRDYLVSHGVTGARINIAGQGESAPVASNDTPSGRQQNRRVELVIQQATTPQQ
jgi:outer membrane protein OmpA-like peptidoglycan-associated protein